MKKLVLGILVCLTINSLFAQTTVKNFPFPKDDVKHLNGEVVDFGNNEMYAIWSRHEETGRVRFFMSKSTDGGNQWQNEITVFDTVVTDATEDPGAGAKLIKGNNNRLLLFIKSGSRYHTYYKYSDNGGIDWTPNLRFVITNTFQSPSIRIISVVHLGGGKLILTGSNGTTIAGTKRSTDNGTTWQTWLSLPTPPFINPSLLSIGDGSFYLAGQQPGSATSHKIYFVKYLSTNTWQDTVIVHEDSSAVLSLPRLSRGNLNELYLYFTKTSKIFGKYNRSNIYYSKSSDEGTSWGAPVQVTKYPGVDGNLNLNSQSQKPYIVFSSDRDTVQGSNYLYWANGLELQDNSTPPVIYNHKLNKDSVLAGDSITIRVFTGSESPLTDASLTGTLNGLPYTLPLFDDGNHNDSLPGDFIYGNFIKVAQEGDLLRFKISVQNPFGTSTTEQILIVCAFPDLVTSMDIRTGRLILPIDYHGNLADVATASGGGMRYDSILSIFSHGFIFSGMTQSDVWAAGQFSASRIKDFQAGQVGYPVTDPRNGIYQISVNDSAFGTSWQRWKGAVSLGARYWDGNNNNIYDPIDLNQNGTWEINEDMPEILGEVSYFTVYNDGVEAALRRFQEEPEGIEIRQTIYTYPNSESDELRDAIFIRYEITKKEGFSPKIEDFILGFQSDPDLGDANDDLVSTDTLRNSMFCYNDGDDPLFGANSPVIYNTILFGNPIYIPGRSFTDLNGNGTFENGIDVPLDTAVIPMGLPFTPLLYPGAMNSGMRVSQHYMQSHPTHGDPNTTQQVRYYHTGKDLVGEYLNPCTWTFGEVRGGVNCQWVNPVFTYSGDPVTNIGWINNTAVDQRTTVASDMTTLDNQSILTYHTAIIAGRGNSPLNSIEVTKANVDTIFTRLGAKYRYIPTSLKETAVTIPDVYELYQNYPNPFNPNTVIKFSIPKNSIVTLKIYDNTGALVKTLVNQEMNSGNHEVSFSGNTFASGVYFYRIESEKFTQTRKMILLK